MLGKKIRLERIFNRDTKKTIIVPMDHGAGMGPIDGLLDFSKAVDNVVDGGANAVIGHVGLPLWGHRKHGKDIGLILHLSVSSVLNPVDGNDKVLVNTVERAIKMGADGVSVHVNIGSSTESKQLKDLGEVAGQCMEWGMPLLAMMYPRGEGIKKGEDQSVKNVKIVARIAAELGADIVKTYYPGSAEKMAEVVEGCPAPVVIAGGAKGGDLEALKMIEGAIKGGAAGLSIGRNAFQREDSKNFIKAACAIVHDGEKAENAINILKK